MRFLKGHGTENDFVILPDPDGVLDLTPETVARLCDRAMVLESHHIAFNGAPDAAVAFYRTGMA